MNDASAAERYRALTDRLARIGERLALLKRQASETVRRAAARRDAARAEQVRRELSS